MHLSGTSRVTVRLASSKPAANLSVWLVVLPWTDGPISPANLITRGWADPQNHDALDDGGDYHARERGEPLVPGRFYTLTFDLQPDDQIIPAGKRIGLMIFSSDRDFTLWPKPGTELTIDLSRTSLRLPVVGGAAAFSRAGRRSSHVRRHEQQPEREIRQRRQQFSRADARLHVEHREREDETELLDDRRNHQRSEPHRVRPDDPERQLPGERHAEKTEVRLQIGERWVSGDSAPVEHEEQWHEHEQSPCSGHAEHGAGESHTEGR